MQHSTDASTTARHTPVEPARQVLIYTVVLRPSGNGAFDDAPTAHRSVGSLVSDPAIGCEGGPPEYFLG